MEGPLIRVDSDVAMDAVVVNRVREIGGIFGIGLKVTTHPLNPARNPSSFQHRNNRALTAIPLQVSSEKPFMVQRVNNLQDMQGASIDAVALDDELLLVLPTTPLTLKLLAPPPPPTLPHQRACGSEVI